MIVFYKEKDLEASASLFCYKDGEKASLLKADWDGNVFWDKTTRCFTTKDDNLYIIEFERPSQLAPLVIKNMPKLNPKSEMILLGSENEVDFQGLKGVKYNMLKWKQDKKGTVTIDFSGIDPKKLDELENAWVIKVFSMKD